jgi:hypothetical protein
MKKRALLILLAAVFIVGTAMAASARDRLNPGEVLMPGQHLLSQNRVYTLSLHKDGNIILRKADLKSKKKWILWNSGTAGTSVTKLMMQVDGNFVMYYNSKPKWSTRTNGNPGSYLVLQNDGNAVIYTKNRRAIWATNTAQ